MSEEPDLTELLDNWVKGDRTALERLAPLVYPQLHSLASGMLSHRKQPATMQATAMVNELFLKLLARRPERLENRQHFYALAAKMIRRALVDHYRANQALKRGGTRAQVALHEDLLWIDANSEQLLDFEQAMTELEELDRQMADLFGMRFLLGCTAEETAELAGLSKATVDRKVKMARGWIYQRMSQNQDRFRED